MSDALLSPCLSREVLIGNGAVWCCVVRVVCAGEQGGRAAYYSLSRLYEHRLGVRGEHFTAYNMLAGPFGGVQGRDLVLAQSMDGKLQAFDQTAEAFACQLPDSLLPGRLLYLRRLDAFVTSTHANRVECYRFQVIQEEGWM